jgi:hypothetical protein
LDTALNALAMNARPRHLEDGSLSDGDNECLQLTHADKTIKTAVKEQKYTVNGKEYTASLLALYWV